jgi:multisubunit Na+/H+ antiporter MnhE subunit
MSIPNPAQPQAGADGNARPGRPAVRRATAWLGWWIVLMAFWLIADDSIALDELLAGAGAAALAAFLVELASHQASVTFGIRLAWLTSALRLPRQVLTETGIVYAALWRRITRGEEPPSGFVAEPVEYGPGTPEGRMRRALLVGARSLAPNTFVLGIDRDRDLMIIHKLVVGNREARR